MDGVFNKDDLTVVPSGFNGNLYVLNDLILKSIFLFLIMNKTHGYMYKDDDWYISNLNDNELDRILISFTDDHFEIVPIVNNQVYFCGIFDTDAAFIRLKTIMEDWGIRKDIIWKT
jgi:hypothetical protein